MKRISTMLAAFLILSSPLILAGERMNKCVDPEGKTTFTTHGCAADESKERIYVPNAQASISRLRPEEVQDLRSIRSKRVRSKQSNTKNHLSWGERQAIKNASVGRKSRILKRPVKKVRVGRCSK